MIELIEVLQQRKLLGHSRVMDIHSTCLKLKEKKDFQGNVD